MVVVVVVVAGVVVVVVVVVAGVVVVVVVVVAGVVVVVVVVVAGVVVVVVVVAGVVVVVAGVVVVVVAAGVTVKVNVRSATPDAFVAVTKYSVAVFTVVGEPDNNPVDVLKDMPAGADGERLYRLIAPPVLVILYPVIAVPTV
jgi:hypothetical protein